MNQCEVDGCGREHYGHGWCRMHWKRWRVHGDPLIVAHNTSPRLMDRLDNFRVEGQCWLWTGEIDRAGYGKLRYEARNWTAHRASWVAFNGLITDGSQVNHKCRNRSCFNPDHLNLGTSQDNHDDMYRDGSRMTGERNGHSKLTELEVTAIRADDRYQTVIGNEYGVSQSTVSAIQTGRTWCDEFEERP